MAVRSEPDRGDPDAEARRRTWLAAERRVPVALSRGGYARLYSPLVTWLTVAV